VAALLFLTIALGGLELTVAVSWAVCLDLGGPYSGSVASVMNTFGQIGGAISALLTGYLATRIGWTSPFLLACAFCLVAALAVRGIDPRRSVAQ
jgi:predicted MFS family arabinose efflux permease